MFIISYLSSYLSNRTLRADFAEMLCRFDVSPMPHMSKNAVFVSKETKTEKRSESDTMFYHWNEVLKGSFLFLFVFGAKVFSRQKKRKNSGMFLYKIFRPTPVTGINKSIGSFNKRIIWEYKNLYSNHWIFFYFSVKNSLW